MGFFFFFQKSNGGGALAAMDVVNGHLVYSCENINLCKVWIGMTTWFGFCSLASYQNQIRIFVDS